MGNERAVLTPADVAKVLGVNQKSIYKELRLGNIPHVKIGDKYLIPMAAFNKWMECNQTKTGAR